MGRLGSQEGSELTGPSWQSYLICANRSNTVMSTRSSITSFALG